jgi:hypothetical protein
MEDVSVDEVDIGSGGIDPGSYKAKFLGATKATTSYGDALKFRWEVIDGPATGSSASRMVSGKPTSGNNAGKLIAALTGAAKAGTRARLSDCIGRIYVVDVRATANGGSRVETCFPV